MDEKATLLALAEEKQALGNEAFKAKHFPLALNRYTEAIELYPTAVLYSNRAFANLKEEYLGSALADANEAIKLDPNYVKAYYRRASALLGMGKMREALRDFKHVVKVAPHDLDAKRKLQSCEKELKKQAFEDAIAVDDDGVLTKLGDIDALVVESSYTGPHLSSEITDEFITDALAFWEKQGKLHRKYALQIMRAVKNIVTANPSLVDINIPSQKERVIIVGDVHGQLYDLLNIFKLNGMPSESNIYLFNGDFVDRGSWSVECILVLFSFKWRFPNHFFLARGNHEANDMNKMYGFEGEVKAKYNDLTFRFFSEIFNALPVAHVVEKGIFVVHGGLAGKDGVKLDEIRALNRFKQPSADPLLQDLLWADPQPFPGRGPSKRGAGLQFGPDVTKTFLDDNGLDLLVRSHEMKEEGYDLEHDGLCLTTFSAPNYW
jgi:serine/threonine-protein phosphatase 5